MKTVEKIRERQKIILGLMGGVFVGIIFLKFGKLASFGLLSGLFLMCLIFNSPVIGILSLMAGICFIPYNTPQLLFNIGSIHIPDLILYFLFFVLLLKIIMSSKLKVVRSPLDIPIIVFFLVGLFSLIFGKIIYSYDFFQAFREFKVIIYYLLAIITVNSVHNKKELKLLIYGCLFIGLITAMNVIFNILISPPTEYETAIEVFYKYQAINAGVLSYWALMCLLCLLLVSKIRISYVLGVVIPLFSFTFSFSRHWWIASVFSVFLAFVFNIKKNKARIFGVLSLTIFLILWVIGLAFLRVEPITTYLNLIALRAESLTFMEEDSSWEYRTVENTYAIEKILANPIWGIGFTRPYRPQIYGPDDNIQWFLHNGYLWILLKLGILGFIPFVWFSYIFVKRGIKNWKRIGDSLFKGIVLGSVISYLGVAIVADLAAAHFMQNWEVAVFGLSFGICEAIYRIEGLDLKYCPANKIAGIG